MSANVTAVGKIIQKEPGELESGGSGAVPALSQDELKRIGKIRDECSRKIPLRTYPDDTLFLLSLIERLLGNKVPVVE